MMFMTKLVQMSLRGIRHTCKYNGRKSQWVCLQ